MAEMFAAKKRDTKKDRYLDFDGHKSYIKIDQLGIAIVLDSTPHYISGCYTDNLASCVAVICEGDKGLALIHETGHIAKQSYDTVVQTIGGITRLSFYHSSFYSEADEILELEPLKEKIIAYIKQKSPTSGSKLSVFSGEAPLGAVTVKRIKNKDQAQIFIDVEGRPEFFICPPGVFPADETATRAKINAFNQGLSEHEAIAGDINFDGRNFYPLPAAKKPVTTLYNKDIFAAYGLIQAQIHSLIKRAKLSPEYINLPSASGLLQQSKENLKEMMRKVGRLGRAFHQIQKITAVYKEFSWIFLDARKPVYLLSADNKDRDQLSLILDHFKAHQQDAHIKNLNLVIRREYPGKLFLELTLGEPFTPKKVPILSARLTSKPVDHKKVPTADASSFALPEQAPSVQATPGKNTAKNRRKRDKKKEKLQAALTTTLPPPASAESTLPSASSSTPIAPGKLSSALFAEGPKKPVSATEPLADKEAECPGNKITAQRVEHNDPASEGSGFEL